jgi:hypothetical protein
MHSFSLMAAARETFFAVLRLYLWGLIMLFAANKDAMIFSIEKQPPLVEDLRNHTPEQMAELRLLLNAGVTGRPDVRRPGFYELDGAENVYYIFRYPTGLKVLLVAAWQREFDPVAEMVACNCPAA